MIKVLKFILLLAASSVHAGPCDSYIVSPYARLVERALETSALKISDLERMAESDSPTNPFARKALVTETVQFHQAFEVLLHDPHTVTNWPSVREGLRAILAAQETSDVKRNEALRETRARIVLKEIWSESVKNAVSLSWCRQEGRDELCYRVSSAWDRQLPGSGEDKKLPQARVVRRADGFPRSWIDYRHGPSAVGGVFEMDGTLMKSDGSSLSPLLSEVFTKSEREAFAEGDKISVVTRDGKYILFIAHRLNENASPLISIFDLSDLRHPKRLQELDPNMPPRGVIRFTNADVSADGVVRVLLKELHAFGPHLQVLKFDGVTFTLDQVVHAEALKELPHPNAVLVLPNGNILLSVSTPNGVDVFELQEKSLRQVTSIQLDMGVSLRSCWLLERDGEPQLVVSTGHRLKIFKPLHSADQILHEHVFPEMEGSFKITVVALLGPQGEVLLLLGTQKAIWLYDPSSQESIPLLKSVGGWWMESPAWQRAENGDDFIAASDGERVYVFKIWELAE